MRSFEEQDAVRRFCREHDKLRNTLRSQRGHKQLVSTFLRRRRFARNSGIALDIMTSAWTSLATQTNVRLLAEELTEPGKVAHLLFNAREQLIELF